MAAGHRATPTGADPAERTRPGPAHQAALRAPGGDSPQRGRNRVEGAVRVVETEDGRGEEIQESGQGDSGDLEDADGSRTAFQAAERAGADEGRLYR